jgi:hypothetical protein
MYRFFFDERKIVAVGSENIAHDSGVISQGSQRVLVRKQALKPGHAMPALTQPGSNAFPVNLFVSIIGVGNGASDRPQDRNVSRVQAGGHLSFECELYFRPYQPSTDRKEGLRRSLRYPSQHIPTMLGPRICKVTQKRSSELVASVHNAQRSAIHVARGARFPVRISARRNLIHFDLSCQLGVTAASIRHLVEGENGMTKPTSETPKDARKSEALKNFEDNLDEIMVVMKRLNIVDLEKGASQLQKAVREATAAAPNIDLKQLTQTTEEFDASVKTYLGFLLPACRWMTVMLVSFMETYLEDGLIEVGKKNPSLINGDPVGTNIIFEVNSIDELRAEIRRHWAHDALRPDGPKKWYRTVKDLGACPLNEKVLHAVQHMWDTRNLSFSECCGGPR